MPGDTQATIARGEALNKRGEMTISVTFLLPVTVRYPPRLDLSADFDGQVRSTPRVDDPLGQVADESATPATR